MRTTILAIALTFGCASVAHAQYYGTPAIGGGYYGGGFSSPYVGLGMGYPSYPAGYGMTAPILLPGFGANTSPRMRATVYPAIPLPSNKVIAARLAGVDDSRATLHLNVPTSNARVWLDGVPMTQSGIRRLFVTPSLEPGSYEFQVRVQWDDESGDPQSRLRKITVSPGSERTVTIR